MKEKMKWLLLSIILIVAPLWKGLFFYGDILIFIVGTMILMGIDFYLARNEITRKRFFTFEPPLLAGVIMIATYALTCVLGSCVSVADTIIAVLKIIYMLVVFIWIRMRFLKVDQNRIILVYVVGAFIGTVVSIMAVSGIINLPDAFLDTRFTGTFQYANAFAAYLMMGIIFTGYLFEITENRRYKLELAAIGFGQFFIFVFTYSRGAWLILPFGLLLTFIILPWKSKISMTLYYVGQLLITVILSKPFIEANIATEVMKPKTIGLFILGMLVFTGYTGLIMILSRKVSNKLSQISKKMVLLVCTILLVLMVLSVSMDQPLSKDLRGHSENERVSVARVIKTISSNTPYILSLNVDAVGDSENSADDALNESPLWSVLVQSIDQQGTISNISIEADFLSKGDIEIPFKTLENTDQLKITFVAGHPNQKIDLDHAAIKDDSGKIIDRIKLSYRFIPEFIITRLESINLNEKVSVGSRLTTYNDTITIFKTQPLIGNGGGAWTALYPKYQTELYYTAVVHNYLAQIMVELGVLGVIALAIIAFGIAYAYITSLRHKQYTEAVIAVAVMTLLGHSLIDFDMSYLSLMMMLWVLMGTLTYPEVVSSGEVYKGKKKEFIVIIGVMVIAALTSVCFYFAETQYNQAVVYKHDHDFDHAIEKYEMAVKMNPFKANYRYELADLLNAKTSESGDLAYAENGNKVLLSAYRNAPYDLNVLKFMIDNNIVIGDFDRALELTDEIIQVAPLRQDPYDVQIQACLTMGDYFISKNDFTKGANFYRYPEKGLIVRYQKNNFIEQKVLMSEAYMDLYERMQFFYRNADNRERLIRVSALKSVSFFEIDVDQDQIPDDWKLKGDQIVKDVDLEPNSFYEIQLHTADTNPETLLKFNSKAGAEDEIVIENAINSDGIYIMAIRTSKDYQPQNHQFVLSKSALEMISAIEIYSIQ